jgi:hypothetical protein
MNLSSSERFADILRKSIGIVSYAVVKISQIRNIMSEEAKSVETQSVLHDKADCGQKSFRA